jgi:hypothetical protein
MPKEKVNSRVDKKLLTVKISYNSNSNRFFVDFWDVNPDDSKAEYLVSINVNENEALGISRDTGIKILEQ